MVLWQTCSLSVQHLSFREKKETEGSSKTKVIPFKLLSNGLHLIKGNWSTGLSFYILVTKTSTNLGDNPCIYMSTPSPREWGTSQTKVKAYADQQPIIKPFNTPLLARNKTEQVDQEELMAKWRTWHKNHSSPSPCL